MAASVAEVAAGLLLVFVLPGFTLAKAIFPEWRVRGAVAIERGVELATLSFLLSVVLTVLVGFVLAGVPSVGFHADWSDPLLEAVLAALAAVAFVVGWGRGAYRREAPVGPTPERAGGSEGGWELLRKLEQNARDSRRLRHQLRTAPKGSAESDRILAELESLEVKNEELRRSREREIAG
jgi:hypothetical protein